MDNDVEWIRKLWCPAQWCGHFMLASSPMLRFFTMILHTYSGESIHPIWNFVSCQLVTDILAEMVAVLHNQMIGVPIIIYREALHELSDLNWVQACCAHENWLPKLKARTLSRLNLKNSARRIIMCTKCIFYSIHCIHGCGPSEHFKSYHTYYIKY